MRIASQRMDDGLGILARRSSRLLLVALGLFLVAACGGETTTPTAADVADVVETTIASTGSDSVDPSPMRAVLVSVSVKGDQQLMNAVASDPEGVTAELMGFALGEITAEWYRADGYFLVFFNGLDTSAAGLLCVRTGFFGPDEDPGFWTEDAMEGATCPGLDPYVHLGPADAPGQLHQCGGSVAYRTGIPEDQGVGEFLESHLIRVLPEGQLVVSARAEMNPRAPTVDAGLFEC